MKDLNIILDTDVGSDCDDMAALAYLIYAKRYLGVNIKAVTYSHTSPYGDKSALSLSFQSFGAYDGRHSWDPATILYAVEGTREFFDESESCTVTVDDMGVCDVNFGEGQHRILSLKSYNDTNEIKLKCAEYIDTAIMKILEESVKI